MNSETVCTPRLWPPDCTYRAVITACVYTGQHVTSRKRIAIVGAEHNALVRVR
jgi:hypothetical protein